MPDNGGRAPHRGLNIRLPEELKRAIERECLEVRTNQNALVVRILGKHFGIDVEDSVSDRRTAPFGGGRPTHRAAS